MINVRKYSYVIPISDELIHPERYPVPPGHIEPPSLDELAAYKAWQERFESLRQEGLAHGWFTDGGPEYGFEYEPPTGEWVSDKTNA